jgi:hypothetical protein
VQRVYIPIHHSWVMSSCVPLYTDASACDIDPCVHEYYRCARLAHYAMHFGAYTPRVRARLDTAALLPMNVDRCRAMNVQLRGERVTNAY